MTKQNVVSIILIALLGFTVYFNSLSGQFIWDDETLIVKNEYLHSWSNIGNIFTHTIGAGAQESSPSYRPLQIVTYLVDHSIWGHNSFGYHLTNLLLHIAVALSIFWLGLVLFKDPGLSFWAGLLFAVHPIHTEAVSYISGRADSLGTFFLLLTLISYLFYLEKKRAGFLLITFLIYSAALFSRESSLIFPLILAIYHYAFRKKIHIKSFVLLIVFSFVYLYIRNEIVSAVIAPPGVASTTTFMERLPGFFVALTTYIKLMVAPFDLHMEYGSSNTIFLFNQAEVIIGVIIFVSILFALVRFRSHSLLCFSLGWFLVTILPVSNLFPLNAYMAEHWLYLPSIGLFLLAGYGFFCWGKAHNLKAHKSIRMVVVLFFCVLTIQQNKYWSNPVSFFERTIKYMPNSERLYNQLGAAYGRKGEIDKLKQVCEKVIQINPSSSVAYSNLAWAYLQEDNTHQAIELYKKQYIINNYSQVAAANLCSVYSNKRERSQAIIWCQKAVEENPSNIDAFVSLGAALSIDGQRAESIKMFQKAIVLDPQNELSYQNICIIYSNLGLSSEAVFFCTKTIEINQDNIDAHRNLGTAYYRLGEKDKSVEHLKKVITLDPNNNESHSNLCTLYMELGNYQEAVKMGQRAIEVNPNYLDAYSNLSIAYTRLNNVDKAIEVLNRVLRIDKKYARAYYDLAVIYFNQKDYFLAIEHADRAQEYGFVDQNFMDALEPYRESHRHLNYKSYD